MKQLDFDHELIQRVLDADDSDDAIVGKELYPLEYEVFQEWLLAGRPLSDKQRAWLYKAAERLGVIEAAPAANVFSSWSKEKQEKERRLAQRQPYEDMPRPLKPPKRA